MNRTIHLVGLNGLRAFAAIAVVVSHIVLASNELGLHPYLFGANDNGSPKPWLLANYGVTIFFSLSGFLITYLLLHEIRERKDVNVTKFYMRRLLRIWPLYYLYLLIAICCLVLLKLDVQYKDLFYYIFFAANVPFILGNGIHLIVHYWSIAVEEQFYLFWPIIVKNGVKRLLFITVTIIISLFCLKILAWGLELKYNIWLPYKIFTVVRFQCMLLGAVGAILYYSGNQAFFNWATSIITQVVSWLIFLSVALNIFRGSVFSDEIISITTVFIIIGQASKKNRVINLDTPLLNFLGKISYGIYIIHPLVIFLFAHYIGNTGLHYIFNYVAVFVCVILITIFLAYISYNLFEKKFLKIKAKYTEVKSSDTFLGEVVQNKRSL